MPVVGWQLEKQLSTACIQLNDINTPVNRHGLPAARGAGLCVSGDGGAGGLVAEVIGMPVYIRCLRSNVLRNEPDGLSQIKLWTAKPAE